MTRRYPRLTRSLAIPLMMVFFLGGCPDNPYDPDTWIEKLDDKSQVKEAITQLQRLKKEKGIEKAIKPLAKVWEDQNKPKKILTVIVEIAETGNGGPHWEEALDVLKMAVDEFDVGDAKSIDSAILAAEALGKSGLKEAVPSLVRALNQPMPKLSPGQRVRLSAVAALGKFGKDKAAVDALVKVMKSDPDKQPPQLFAAAALAMADARSPDAVEPLIVAMFKIAPIYAQCRRALINIGPPARDRLLKIFNGKDEVLNQLAKDNKFNIDCKETLAKIYSGQMKIDDDKNKCRAPSNLEYKSALLLGDFYSSEPVPSLIKGLDDDPLPSYFEPNNVGPTQHTAILNALKLIGDPSAADRVWSYATDSKTDDGVRPMSIDTYSFLTQDTGKLDELAKMIKDDDADEQVRMAAGIAHARLARSEDAYDPIMYMVDRYRKKAEEKDKELKKAEAPYKKAKDAYDALNKEYLKKKADGDDDAKLKAKVKEAQKKMEGKQQIKSGVEGDVAGYRSFQRSFEQNLARAHIATLCKKDPMCYADILDKKPEYIGTALSKYIKDWDKWSDDEKKNLLAGATERALIELRKMGKAGAPATDKLLAKVDTEDGIIRQGILMALVKIAPLPCDKCVTRFDEVLKEQKDQSTLQRLSVETQAVRGYFLWAGK